MPNLTNKQIAERLRRWADAVAAKPKREFDMGTWGCEKYRFGVHCGTVHCAAGTAAVTPYFKRKGLRLDFSDSRIVDPDWENDEVRANVVCENEAGERLTGEQALAHVTGATVPQIANIVYATKATKAEIVKAIRALATIYETVGNVYQ